MIALLLIVIILVVLGGVLIAASDAIHDPRVTTLAPLLIAVIAFVFIGFGIFVGNSTTVSTDYKIINLSEIKEIVEENKLNKLEELNIYYKIDGKLHEKAISRCDVVFGNEYKYKEEVLTVYFYGLAIDEFTTCEVIIKE